MKTMMDFADLVSELKVSSQVHLDFYIIWLNIHSPFFIVFVCAILTQQCNWKVAHRRLCGRAEEKLVQAIVLLKYHLRNHLHLRLLRLLNSCASSQLFSPNYKLQHFNHDQSSIYKMFTLDCTSVFIWCFQKL